MKRKEEIKRAELSIPMTIAREKKEERATPTKSLSLLYLVREEKTCAKKRRRRLTQLQPVYKGKNSSLMQTL